MLLLFNEAKMDLLSFKKKKKNFYKYVFTINYALRSPPWKFNCSIILSGFEILSFKVFAFNPEPILSSLGP